MALTTGSSTSKIVKNATRPDPAELNVLSYVGWKLVPALGPIRVAFLARFRRERDLYWRVFDEIASSRAELQTCRSRVRGAVQITAAYSGWYAVSKSMALATPQIALILGFLFAIVFAAKSYERYTMQETIVDLALAAAILLAVFTVAWKARYFRMRRLLTALGAFATLLVFSTASWAKTPSFAVTYGSSLLESVVLVFGFGFAWLVFRGATNSRLRTYPDDEVIQSLLVALHHATDSAFWARSNKRRILSADLEWIALRLERECCDTLSVGGAPPDFDVTKSGQKRAAAMRLWKSSLAFPEIVEPLRYQAFLEAALKSASTGDWAALAEADIVVWSPQAKGAVVLTALSKALAPISIVLVLGFGIRLFTHSYDEAIEKVSIFSGIWAALFLLRMADPDNFDAQVQAARAVKEVF